MQPALVEFDNVLTKQSVVDWADARGFTATDVISLHFTERFNVERIVIHSVDNRDDFLLLKISTDQWHDQRDFALTSTGSLAW